MDELDKRIIEAYDSVVNEANYTMIFFDSDGKRMDSVETKAKSSADAFEQAKTKKPSDAKTVDLVVNKRSIGKYDLSSKKLKAVDEK